MPKKFEKKAQAAALQGPQNGLLKALEETGRVRGSSATPKPTILSPTPSGGKSFQDHIEKLQKMTLENDPGIPRNTKFGQSSGFNGNSASGSSSGGGVPLSSPNQKSTTVQQLAEECQARLNTLIAMIQKAKLSPQAQIDLTGEVQAIGTDFREHQKRLTHEVERITRDKDYFQGRLVETARHLQATTTDRDHLRTEVVTIRSSMEALRQEYTQRGVDMLTAANDFKAEIERLTRKLTSQDEQLKGKRALWLESNPGSSSRRSAMSYLYDPFSSPLTTGTFSPSFGSGNVSQRQTPMASPGMSRGSFQSSTSSPQNTTFESFSAYKPSPKMQLPSIPESMHSRRRGGPPRHKAKKSHDYAAYLPSVHSTRRITTEPGDTPMNPNYGAMVLFNKDPEYDPSPEFMEDFTKIFVQVEGWVKDHANVGNPAEDEELIKNELLWEYMMNCTYPGKKNDAFAHTLNLIKDRGCRYWFVMRMITTYLFNEMLSINAWADYASHVDKILEDVAAQLAKERGLPNDARQKLIERRAAAIRSVIGDPSYLEWRTQKLNAHTRELRNMLGPMLNAGSDRVTAGRDLGTLAIRVWDQSAKNNSAPYTFQTYFPDTNSKFSAGSMIARDRPNVDPTQLQIKQVRVKLVITPVVTLRNDCGTTIKAKSLHFATVLLMA